MANIKTLKLNCQDHTQLQCTDTMTNIIEWLVITKFYFWKNYRAIHVESIKTDGHLRYVPYRLRPMLRSVRDLEAFTDSLSGNANLKADWNHP